MTKLKAPLFSLKATGRLGKLLALARRGGRNILERRPIPTDAKSSDQLFFRHMFTKCIDLWHLLSEAEKQEWESAARPRHMTGYAWYMSQCLRPNPGIYLPLQGGIMQGIIDMDGFAISDLLDPVNPQDADTEAARDAAIAAALAGSLHCDIYAYDGSNWQDLRVESSAQHNLRVRLYDGANGIDSDLLTAAGFTSNAQRGIYTRAQLNLQGDLTTAHPWRTASYLADAHPGFFMGTVGLWGYNGATWDRLRTYGTGTLKVGRADIGLVSTRRTTVGQVKASPGELYWMVLNPSAGNSLFELSNDLDGSTAIIVDHFDTTRDGHIMTFDPPLSFATGIYLKTITNITSITFGYK